MNSEPLWRRLGNWARPRLKPVVLVSAIVAATIVSVIIAVVTSAQRADTSALAHEQLRLTRTIGQLGERALHELASSATTPRAMQNVRQKFDRDWVDRCIGLRLTGDFQHDLVLVFDGADRLAYAHARDAAGVPALDGIRAELAPLIDAMRGRGAAPATVAKAFTRIQTLAGRPALVAATLVAPPAPVFATAADLAAPLAVSIKFIDDDVLADIANRLDIADLHRLGDDPPPPQQSAFALRDDDGNTIVTYAWTPKRLGHEIVASVLPYIVVAAGGFMVLAAFVVRHMRRTATTIAAGEQRLRHLALHDPLSGLPNRTYFSERIESLIEQVRGGSPPAAAFYLDLDHFKEVNDTLGHPVGDELLRHVAERLTRALRSADMVARLGGDEFAVLTATATDRETAHAIAMRIINTLCSPYTINGHSMVIGVSIGIAVIHDKVESAADVMRYADMALYRAKSEGRNRACIYDAVMDADQLDRKQLETDLRSAIDDGEIEIAYQPIVDAATERIVGVEALARWRHPQRGAVPPSVFIPIAENTGLITALGERVLREACLAAKAWPELTVAVNVSPIQFRRADFVDVVERVLENTGCDPARLELELTESTFIGAIDRAETSMRHLKMLGVRLALDDFGTGYSSLQYLRRFPFDKLKIDHGFVHSIETAVDAAAIVHAMVSLSRGLTMTVTAEGVETAEQQVFLRAAGVHTLQGYRFGRPMPAGQISLRLAEQTVRYAEELPRALAG
ncbi:MAG TPA: EAL domain-containing protein [Xanthobacteraceae bacterium]|nr:EAL domain-containing protein [Xanthobacteraceae bacterium]